MATLNCPEQGEISARGLDSGMKIERDGSVVIASEHAGTFRDFRLPLVQRLEKLALLVGSDSWTSDQAPHAESLIREAALRLSGFMTEAAGRQSVLDAITSWNNALREENERLRRALFDSSGRGME